MKNVAKSIESIKRIVISAIYSDDELLNRFVLKGANVLDLVYGIAPRSSLDIDFSIEGDFSRDELKLIEEKIYGVLDDAFTENGLRLFDFSFEARPARGDVPIFWGGYLVAFKLAEVDLFSRLGDDIESIRRQSTVIGERQKRIFTIDISKHEFCADKTKHLFDGSVIYSYSPQMLMLEKLRAICQQMEEYSQYVPSPSRSPRARDFFDVHTLNENFSFDFADASVGELLKLIFAAKKVPIAFLLLISNYREFHRPDFQRVIDTVKPGQSLRDFDFYFDYVLGLVDLLKSFWIK